VLVHSGTHAGVSAECSITISELSLCGAANEPLQSDNADSLYAYSALVAAVPCSSCAIKLVLAFAGTSVLMHETFVLNSIASIGQSLETAMWNLDG